MRLGNLLFYFSIFFFLGCENSHQDSFNLLYSAFQKWYVNYNPALQPIKEIEYSQHGKLQSFDYIDLDEYNEDLMKFKIELSQINKNKLNDKQYSNYLAVEQYIEYMLLIYKDEKRYQWKPSMILYHIYDGLSLLIKSEEINVDLKTDYIISRLDQISNILQESKKIINSISDREYDEIQKVIKKLIKILQNLYLHISFNPDKIDYVDLLVKQIIKDLNNYEINIKTKLNLTNQFDSNFYKSYFKKYYQNKYDLNKIIFLANRIIKEKHEEMLKIALPIYIAGDENGLNNEPVWVDVEDTLEVISWVLNKNEQAILYENIDFYTESYLHQINNYLHKNNIIENLDKPLVRIAFNDFNIDNHFGSVQINFCNEHVYCIDYNYSMHHILDEKINIYDLNQAIMMNVIPKLYLFQNKMKEDNYFSVNFNDDLLNRFYSELSMKIINELYLENSDINITILYSLKYDIKNALRVILENKFYNQDFNYKDMIRFVKRNAFLNEQESIELVNEVYSNTFQMTLPFVSYLEYNKINRKLNKDDKKIFNHVLKIANDRTVQTFTELKKIIDKD